MISIFCRRQSLGLGLCLWSSHLWGAEPGRAQTNPSLSECAHPWVSVSEIRKQPPTERAEQVLKKLPEQLTCQPRPQEVWALAEAVVDPRVTAMVTEWRAAALPQELSTLRALLQRPLSKSEGFVTGLAHFLKLEKIAGSPLARQYLSQRVIDPKTSQEALKILLSKEWQGPSTEETLLHTVPKLSDARPLIERLSHLPQWSHSIGYGKILEALVEAERVKKIPYAETLANRLPLWEGVPNEVSLRRRLLKSLPQHEGLALQHLSKTLNKAFLMPELHRERMDLLNRSFYSENFWLQVVKIYFSESADSDWRFSTEHRLEILSAVLEAGKKQISIRQTVETLMREPQIARDAGLEALCSNQVSLECLEERITRKPALHSR